MVNPVSQILFAILWWSNLKICPGQTLLSQNPRYKGPTDCDEIVKNHYTAFSEYPQLDPTTSINFLEMGDPCNHAAEEEFLREMRTAFLNGIENGERMRLLAQIWERWRAEASSGSIAGKRICNPKRLLECQASTQRCVCRSTMKLFDAKDRQFDDEIAIDVVVTEKEIPYTSTFETVTECKAKVNSICQWNVPFLGFCFIPCAQNGSACVGQPDDAKRCRICNPPKDIGGDADGHNKCFQEAHQGHSVGERMTISPLTFTLIFGLSCLSSLT